MGGDFRAKAKGRNGGRQDSLAVAPDAISCYVEVMTRADIISTLRSQAPDLKALGATSHYLFGSTARGEARDDSDVDLFIDYDPERFSFVELIRLRERVSHVLGRPADLTTREGLHPILRSGIEAEAVKVF